MATNLAIDASLPTSPPIRQIDALQFLRAVAVILVIWCHAGQVLAISQSSPIPGLGVFGVDIFFVISGFILSLTVLKERSRPGIGAMLEFMERRFLRIYPIYWFICIVTLARLTLSHHLFDHDWIASFFLLPSFQYPGQAFVVSFSWTMNFEIFFYFVLGLTLVVTVRRAVPVLITLLVASTVVGFIVGIRRPVISEVCNPILLEFVFGAVIALLHVRFGRRRVVGIILFTVGWIAAFYVASQSLTWVANGEQMILLDIGPLARVATWGLCAASIVGGVVFWSPSMKSGFGKCFVVLGNAAYSTYLASALFIEFSFRLIYKIHAPPIVSLIGRLIFEVSILLFVLIGGFAVYKLIEKPLLRMLHAKFLKHAKTEGTLIASPHPLPRSN